MNKDIHLIYEAFEQNRVPSNLTAIQNLLINQLKKHGFQLLKVGHINAEEDSYPTVFMKRVKGPMHSNAEISPMGAINDEHYEDYLANLKAESEDAESADEKKERVQRGWDINKKRWAKWKMENPEAAAKHAAKKAGRSEDAEMPTKDFNKLKQHINKGPIQIKKPSKELPYTHKYIHHLAKQDSREGQKEEDAESACIEDLATRHGVSLEDITNQLEMGLKVEMEHTEDMDVAKKIALDHLAEDPHYYTKLAKMEGKGENEERRIDPKCWKGYHKAGTKLKSGVRVNNCVKN